MSYDGSSESVLQRSASAQGEHLTAESLIGETGGSPQTLLLLCRCHSRCAPEGHECHEGCPGHMALVLYSKYWRSLPAWPPLMHITMPWNE